ncbi:transposase [Bradyrhizobium sp. CCBAU 53380]|uniref:transposase n=1 Tax=Bradyrhizobium sp. CCBAU 53380 TaxID=1325117 RepID=UPI003FA40A99
MRWAKERLADIWDNRNRAGARSALEDWIKSLPAEIAPAFRPVLTALNDWKAELLASWDRKIEDTYVNAADDVLNVLDWSGRYGFETARSRILTAQAAPTRSTCGECRGEFPIELRSRSRRYNGDLCANLSPGANDGLVPAPCRAIAL